MSLESPMSDELPVNLSNPDSIKPGTEAHSIIEFGPAQNRKVIKEIDPINFHLPGEVRNHAKMITDQAERATYLATYKKNEYEDLAKVFGEQIAETNYIVFKAGSDIRVGIIQSKIDGDTISKLKRGGNISPRIESALQKFLYLITWAQKNSEFSKTAVFAGYVPTAKELLDPYFEPPSYMPDLCNLANLIYDQNNDKVIAIDW